MKSPDENTTFTVVQRHDAKDIPMPLDASDKRYVDPDAEGIQMVRDALMSAGFRDECPIDYEYGIRLVLRGTAVDVSLCKDTSRVAYVTSVRVSDSKVKSNVKYLGDALRSRRAIQVLIGSGGVDPIYVPIDGIRDEERADYIVRSVLAAVAAVAARMNAFTHEAVRAIAERSEQRSAYVPETAPSTPSEEM